MKALRGVAVLLLLVISQACPAQGLPSWNDGPARRAIVAFVASVTSTGSPNFVAAADRIAVFDNDGTLWPERPLPFQLMFMLDRVRALAPQHPEWKEQQPFKSILAGDVESALAGGEQATAELIAATHAGMTTEEFEVQVRDWIRTARHPRFNRPYTDLAYQPMLELLAYLRDHDFRTFIVSGGGIDFMRAWAQQVYGIPPEQVIGSQGRLAFELRQGKPVLVKQPQIDLVDDGPGKPIAIQRAIGRRPVAAFGNSDGDLPMLQWTMAGPGRRLALIVHHTDAVREWAYDRVADVGKLDKALDAGQANGWTIVDMKRDWKRVFSFE
ncbi:MAG: HAD family hydrolase [Betaproteobacteria bacterium]